MSVERHLAVGERALLPLVSLCTGNTALAVVDRAFVMTIVDEH
jgi:hypothetical protein